MKMTENTVLEALTIELLGDVGKLNDEIKYLPENLSNAVKELTNMHVDGVNASFAEINESILSIPDIFDSKISEKLKAISDIFENAQKIAEHISTEQINDKINKNTDDFFNLLNKHLEDGVKPIDKMQRDVQFLATFANNKKPTVMPVLITGLSVHEKHILKISTR